MNDKVKIKKPFKKVPEPDNNKTNKTIKIKRTLAKPWEFV